MKCEFQKNNSLRSELNPQTWLFSLRAAFRRPLGSREVEFLQPDELERQQVGAGRILGEASAQLGREQGPEGERRRRRLGEGAVRPCLSATRKPGCSGQINRNGEFSLRASGPPDLLIFKMLKVVGSAAGVGAGDTEAQRAPHSGAVSLWFRPGL